MNSKNLETPPPNGARKSDAPDNSKTFPPKSVTDRLKKLFQEQSQTEAVDLLESFGFFSDDALFILGWWGGVE
jgi:hypothetical protein